VARAWPLFGFSEATQTISSANRPMMIEAAICSLNSVRKRKAVSVKTNEASPASSETIRLPSRSTR
jgi:hypothetical protein